MEQTRSNTRRLLIWNKAYPHQTPSLAADDSYSCLNRPQEDNAGPPSERYQSSSNNSPSPAHHTLALHASGHLPGSISSCLFLSAYNAEHNHEYTLETIPWQLSESDTNSQQQPPKELSGKLSGESLLLKLLLQLQTHCSKQTALHCHELTVWQALRQNRTLKYNPMVKSTSPDYARMKTNLKDRTIGQCDIPKKS